MDERSIEFVRSLIAGHIERARLGQPASHTGRGARLLELHRRVVEEAEATVADVDTQFQASNDDETRRYSQRTLQRTLTEVEAILPFLAR
ncbi:MAG: hypothetical protein OXB92_01130 [Acidimicrobiaceae bacterium]|nr:hypothetical protein [Acidimicrobiia bacterium]MCY4492444.1 hypothetical protein [Acidimicrobiaceae bacterium]